MTIEMKNKTRKLCETLRLTSLSKDISNGHPNALNLKFGYKSFEHPLKIEKLQSTKLETEYRNGTYPWTSIIFVYILF